MKGRENFISRKDAGAHTKSRKDIFGLCEKQKSLSIMRSFNTRNKTAGISYLLILIFPYQSYKPIIKKTAK